MKRILIVLLSLAFVFSVSAETIEIETSRGKVNLYVPETYSELQSAYLEMAGLYLEERYDLEEALDEIDKLTKEVDNYIEKVEELEEKIKELEETKNPFLQNQLFAGVGVHTSPTPSSDFSIGYGVVLADMFTISVVASYPSLRATLLGGITF